MPIKSIDAQQLDRLLISEDKKHHIKALLRLAPEAQLLRDDMELTIHGIVINQPETQADYSARVQSSVVSAAPAERKRVKTG